MKTIKPYTPPPKYLTGEMKYQITIKDGNIDLQFQDSNENRLIALEMTRKIMTEIAQHKMKSDFHGVELKDLNTAIRVTGESISTLALHIIEKYKDAVPEEKKVKILKFNPITDKLPNLKL